MSSVLTAPLEQGGRQRKDVTLLTAGTMVSVAGDAAALIALLLELRTAGAGWVAAVLAAEFLPFVVFASPSGRLVDRLDNRRLLVAALIAQAVVVTPLAFARTPWMIVALVFALSSVSTMVRPAVNSMIPALTGEEHAASGYAWVATGSGVGWIVGPALGGLLTSAFGVSTALLVDAATFLVLAAACSQLSATRGHAQRRDSPQSRLGGTAIVWRDTVLRWSVLVTAVVIACAVVDNVAAPFRFVDQLRSSPAGYGFYLALWGVGALGGTQLPRLMRQSAMPTALAVGNMMCGLGILGIGVAPGVAVAFAASTFGGVGNGIANVATSALVSGRVPPHERGRAFASVSGFIQAGTGSGTIAAAPLVAALGAGAAMTVAGAVSAAIAGGTAIWLGVAVRE